MPPPDRAGFALIGALFVVIGIAGVALIALMTMTLSSSKVTFAENANAREVRAADNALESAINMIRMDPTGELGSLDSCLPGDEEDEEALEFPSNGRAVTVTGACEASPQIIRTDTVTSPDAPSVQLVGTDGYQPLTDALDWTNDCLGGSEPCAPWISGIGNANYSTFAGDEFDPAKKRSLVHFAADDPEDLNKTLTVGGHVQARRGSATMIPESEARAPAVQVAGNYRQADPGLFAPQSPTECGIIAPGHPWTYGAQVIDSDGSEDAQGEPTCEADEAFEADLAELERDGLGSPPPFGANFTSADFVTVPTTCPVGATVELPPGAYGKAQTAALNNLLDGSCGGDNVFWFKPGSYWFDVDDPSAPTQDLRNSLIIDDPSARVIFGTPAAGGSAAEAAFPAACDPAGAGVEIELSARTTLQHLDGRVAICDLPDSAATEVAPPALWQTGNADGGWYGVPSGGTVSVINSPNVTYSVSNGGEGWSKDRIAATYAFGCDTDSIAWNQSCVQDLVLRGDDLSMEGAESPPSRGRLDSLDLVLRARFEPDDDWDLSDIPVVQEGKFGTEVRFFKDGFENGATCGVYYPYLPNNYDDSDDSLFTTLAIDLLSPTAESITESLQTCRTAEDNGVLRRDGLDGADVEVVQKMSVYGIYGYSVNVDSTYAIDGFELRAGWDLTGSSASGVGWNSDSDPNNALTTDGSTARRDLECSWWPGNGCPSSTPSLDIAGFDNRLSPLVPVDGALLEAGLVVTGETSDTPWLAHTSGYNGYAESEVHRDSDITVEISNLANASAGSCTASWPKVPFYGQGIYLDLLNDPDVQDNTCSGVLTDAKQLIGATVHVDYHLQRNGWACEHPPLCLPVEGDHFGGGIDSVRLSTVTSGQYDRLRAPMVLTIGNEITPPDEGAPGTYSSFNVFGRWSMPHNDLNVHWNGPAPVDAETSEVVPIGGGTTILSGLASYVAPGGEAGILCCSPTKPAERIVNLEATLDDDGTPRVVGTARVVINDVDGPGAGLTIEEWSIG